MTQPPRRPARRRAAWLVALGLLLSLGAFLFLGIGRWLVVSDSLERADAIVVFSGHLPFRAMEAAQIYRQGYAPEIWLTRPTLPEEEKALARLRVSVTGEEAYNERVLLRLGVPKTAIKTLSQPVLNTEQEVLLIARTLEQAGGKSVILVTSKSHTRRVKAIWKALAGNRRKGIVRYASEDPFDRDRWWRRTRDAVSVVRETLGLLNVWTGFPLRPDRPEEKKRFPPRGRIAAGQVADAGWRAGASTGRVTVKTEPLP